MNNLLPSLESWLAEGDRIAVATVVSTGRSAPRPAGTKMAVNEHGAIAGQVSGGCVEGAVIAAADEVLRGAEPRLLHFGIADDLAWEVGLPCGGEIDVWVDRLHVEDLVLWGSGGRGAVVTRLDDGRRMRVLADGSADGVLGDDLLEAAVAARADELMWVQRSEACDVAGVRVFIDCAFPPPRLLIVGAVDVAAPLSAFATVSGWLAYVIDPRTRFATRERFPQATEVLPLWPAAAFDRLGLDRATAVACLTHDPKIDDEALLSALGSSAAYVGAMGSRRAQEDRRARLLTAGLDPILLDDLSAPIGLDIGSRTAPEMAMSIMSEVVAHRNGRAGGRLRDGHGRIHAAARH